MPTYRNITDNEVAVGLPVTQQLIQTMRDNIEAIFQGDATAPEVQWQALSRSGTPAAGNALILQITTELNADDTSVFGFGVRKTGTYRVRFEQRVADTPDTDSDDGVLQTNTFVSQLVADISGTAVTIPQETFTVAGVAEGTISAAGSIDETGSVIEMTYTYSFVDAFLGFELAAGTCSVTYTKQ